MGVIRWETPPEPSRRYTDWREVNRLLRTRPGEWAVVYEGHTPQAAGGQMSHLRGGRCLPMTPTRDFEYRRAGRTLYARFIGHEIAVIEARRATLKAM